MHEAVSRHLFAEGVKGLGPELCAARGWALHVAEFPILELGFSATGRQSIRMRATCNDWNGLPPSVEWLDNEGKALTAIPQGSGGQLNNSAHPVTGRPFVCMAGVREYHTHSSHVGDSWENYRERSGYDLGGVLTQLWRVWLEASP
jgi:hypothetical protein